MRNTDGKKLTAKQEALCLKYVEGGASDKTAAYRSVYNCANMRAETIHKKACIEFDKGKIRGRIDELRGRLEDEAIADAKERLKFWTDVMRGKQLISIDGEERTLPVNIKDRLKASELLGKAFGDFVDRKILQNPDGTGINQQTAKTRQQLIEEAREFGLTAEEIGLEPE